MAAQRIILLLLLLGLTATSVGTAADLGQQRQFYRAADQAATNSNWREVERLRAQLGDYPLALYLDYRQLDARMRHVSGSEATEFVTKSANSPLQLRFKDRYLRRSGRDRRWQDYLSLSDQPPRSIELQCYYYRARHSEGDLSQAWEGARSLWLYGRSRPKACDPLFANWQNAGQLTDELVWRRLLLAFAERRGGLMAYVGRQGSEALQPQVEAAMQVYRSPTRLGRSALLPVDQNWSGELIVTAMPRLARVDIHNAMRLWPQLRETYNFSAADVIEVEEALAHRILLRHEGRWAQWLDEFLRGAGNDALLERRLRWVLRDSDWPLVLDLAARLTPAGQGAGVWQFWQAQALQNLNREAEARLILNQLAADRNYYGFAAAQQLGQAYALNHEPLLAIQPTDGLDQKGGFQRTGELIYHQQPRLAQSEWAYLLRNVETRDQEYLAWRARSEGWYGFAIDAANKAGASNRLELRFPLAYEDAFRRSAQLHEVQDTELMAIARRESAFFPHARSSAGARGLMQLMPATARQVARQLGEASLSTRLYDVDANVALGSAYYRQLLDDYDGNRALSLAAYNAGPHRVRKWRSESGEEVSIWQWVDSIPFRETRDYVQAVLAYNLVYQDLQGEDTDLFTRSELGARY